MQLPDENYKMPLKFIKALEVDGKEQILHFVHSLSKKKKKNNRN